mmetsp:Transcript_61713/g.135184  ORF Transcript_61713/g.135184 Transcript_61713/m.135184 type:complete len:194 (+) Transcript_61713:52-633(+)
MIGGGSPISQLAPLGIVLLLQNYDIEKLGYLVHLRVVYGVIQLCCLCLLIYIRLKINALPDGDNIKVPATVQLGVEVKPAVEQTTKEYDESKWGEQMQQHIIGCIVLTFIHVHWGHVTPLAFQAVMAPIQLMEAPLVKIHLLGKPADGSLKRPFPPPSLFPGMPQDFGLPQEQSTSPAKDKDKSKKDKSKKSK